jgi:chromate reductase, NAD(P)H dehydrogenase (quinone)
VASSTVHILGIAGSLRAGSFNRALLRANVELAPPGVALDVFDISNLPLYNADLDTPATRPATAAALRDAISGADAVLIVTPEHNWGPSAATKNVIDWGSRPPEESVWRLKPVALQGASIGPFGTLRAQLQIRQHLQAQPAFVLIEPAVQLTGAAARFDGELRLIDEDARERVTAQLAALRDWAIQLAC